MFTGLIEETGMIQKADLTEAGSRIEVSALQVMEDAKPGDSIAVDGVCTTVVELTEQSFVMEASPETLSKTTFGQYAAGTKVNLERPMTFSSRVGGHFVTGHVDSTATVVSREPEGMSWIYRFRLDNSDLVPLLVEKGSVAVSGISLTVNTVEEDTFSVAIIPFTMEHTNLGEISVGDKINIECDLLGKYVQRLMQHGSKKEIHAKEKIHEEVLV